ncbi:hypothetical protein ACLQ2D_02060 [Streptomyces sp. DT199]|uniref:hypothetical protein n=1 Tax=Streptomyces sp. DT199 TaxID=3393421 RepID=UPI003CEA4303
MSADHRSGDDGLGACTCAGRAAACVRAALFALVGSVLAALGHHAVAEGAVPWRLVTAFALAQFAIVWPLARRRLSLPVVIVCTLVAQFALHLALMRVDSTHLQAAPSANMGGGHATMALGDGHAWHHASTAMTTAHLAAALVATWLLQRADAAVAAALITARAVRRLAEAIVSWTMTSLAAGATPRPLVLGPIGRFEPPAAARTRTLEHALVRRGPPGHALIPNRPFSLCWPLPARLHQ